MSTREYFLRKQHSGFSASGANMKQDGEGGQIKASPLEMSTTGSSIGTTKNDTITEVPGTSELGEKGSSAKEGKEMEAAPSVTSYPNVIPSSDDGTKRSIGHLTLEVLRKELYGSHASVTNALLQASVLKDTKHISKSSGASEDPQNLNSARMRGGSSRNEENAIPFFRSIPTSASSPSPPSHPLSVNVRRMTLQHTGQPVTNLQFQHQFNVLAAAAAVASVDQNQNGDVAVSQDCSPSPPRPLPTFDSVVGSGGYSVRRASLALSERGAAGGGSTNAPLTTAPGTSSLKLVNPPHKANARREKGKENKDTNAEEDECHRSGSIATATSPTARHNNNLSVRFDLNTFKAFGDGPEGRHLSQQRGGYTEEDAGELSGGRGARNASSTPPPPNYHHSPPPIPFPSYQIPVGQGPPSLSPFSAAAAAVNASQSRTSLFAGGLGANGSLINNETQQILGTLKSIGQLLSTAGVGSSAFGSVGLSSSSFSSFPPAAATAATPPLHSIERVEKEEEEKDGKGAQDGDGTKEVSHSSKTLDMTEASATPTVAAAGAMIVTIANALQRLVEENLVGFYAFVKSQHEGEKARYGWDAASFAAVASSVSTTNTKAITSRGSTTTSPARGVTQIGTGRQMQRQQGQVPTALLPAMTASNALASFLFLQLEAVLHLTGASRGAIYLADGSNEGEDTHPDTPTSSSVLPRSLPKISFSSSPPASSIAGGSFARKVAFIGPSKARIHDPTWVEGSASSTSLPSLTGSRGGLGGGGPLKSPITISLEFPTDIPLAALSTIGTCIKHNVGINISNASYKTNSALATVRSSTTTTSSLVTGEGQGGGLDANNFKTIGTSNFSSASGGSSSTPDQAFRASMAKAQSQRELNVLDALVIPFGDGSGTKSVVGCVVVADRWRDTSSANFGDDDDTDRNKRKRGTCATEEVGATSGGDEEPVVLCKGRRDVTGADNGGFDEADEQCVASLCTVLEAVVGRYGVPALLSASREVHHHAIARRMLGEAKQPNQSFPYSAEGGGGNKPCEVAPQFGEEKSIKKASSSSLATVAIPSPPSIPTTAAATSASSRPSIAAHRSITTSSFSSSFSSPPPPTAMNALMRQLAAASLLPPTCRAGATLVVGEPIMTTGTISGSDTKSATNSRNTSKTDISKKQQEPHASSAKRLFDKKSFGSSSATMMSEKQTNPMRNGRSHEDYDNDSDTRDLDALERKLNAMMKEGLEKDNKLNNNNDNLDDAPTTMTRTKGSLFDNNLVKKRAPPPKSLRRTVVLRVKGGAGGLADTLSNRFTGSKKVGGGGGRLSGAVEGEVEEENNDGDFYNKQHKTSSSTSMAGEQFQQSQATQKSRGGDETLIVDKDVLASLENWRKKTGRSARSMSRRVQMNSLLPVEAAFGVNTSDGEGAEEEDENRVDGTMVSSGDGGGGGGDGGLWASRERQRKIESRNSAEIVERLAALREASDAATEKKSQREGGLGGARGMGLASNNYLNTNGNTNSHTNMKQSPRRVPSTHGETTPRGTASFVFPSSDAGPVRTGAGGEAGSGGYGRRTILSSVASLSPTVAAQSAAVTARNYSNVPFPPLLPPPQGGGGGSGPSGGPRRGSVGTSGASRSALANTYPVHVISKEAFIGEVGELLTSVEILWLRSLEKITSLQEELGAFDERLASKDATIQKLELEIRRLNRTFAHLKADVTKIRKAVPDHLAERFGIGQ